MDKFTHNMNSPDAFEHRFKALSTAISGVVYSFNPDWSIMYELDGRGFLSDVTEPTADWKKRNVYPEDIEKVDNAIAEAIKNKCVLELEHRVLKADRTVGWTFSRAVPILNDKGEIKEWFGVASDITERKLAEQSLKKSREILEQQKRTYETIISGTPDLMYVFDLNYRFTYANQALLQMWGKTWD
ncbi:MAG: PAS domain-containing protein, partial [Sphingobacteriales bacterium]